MVDETPLRDDLPALGDPDDDGGDFAIEHQATTVDNDRDQAAEPAAPETAPPANGDR